MSGAARQLGLSKGFVWKRLKEMGDLTLRDREKEAEGEQRDDLMAQA